MRIGACRAAVIMHCHKCVSISRQDCEALQLASASGERFPFCGVEALLAGSVDATAALQPPHAVGATAAEGLAPLSGACTLQAVCVVSSLRFGGQSHSVQAPLANCTGFAGLCGLSACRGVSTSCAILLSARVPQHPCRWLTLLARLVNEGAQLANQAVLAARGAVARYYEGELRSDDELAPGATRDVRLA